MQALTDNFCEELARRVAQYNDARTVTPQCPKVKRGFAAMDPARHREICSLGGRTAHATGAAHILTAAEVKTGGGRGGKRAHENGTAHVLTREEKAIGGRKGGQALRVKRRAGKPLIEVLAEEDTPPPAA